MESAAPHQQQQEQLQHVLLPSFCGERQRLKEELRGGNITIDDAIREAAYFAQQPGVNGCGQQLVRTLEALKPWLLQTCDNNKLYIDFVNRALRRSHAHLPTKADFIFSRRR